MSGSAAAFRSRVVWGVWIVATVVFAAERIPFDDTRAVARVVMRAQPAA